MSSAPHTSGRLLSGAGRVDHDHDHVGSGMADGVAILKAEWRWLVEAIQTRSSHRM